MNTRVLAAGVIGGVLSSLALSLPFYFIMPATYSQQWPNVPGSLGWAGSVGAILIALLTGYIAAQWGWADSPRTRLRYGLVAGGAAGLVSFCLVGGGAAGVAAHAPIFLYGARPAKNDAQMVHLMGESLIAVFWFTHIAYYGLCLIGAALGGLGALSARRSDTQGWGSKPRPIAPAIWRMLSLAAFLWASLCVLVSVAVLYQMATRIEASMVKYPYTPTFPAGGVFAWPVGTMLGWLVLCAWWSWSWVQGWQHEAPPVRRKARITGVLLICIALGLVAMLYDMDPSVYRPITVIGMLVFLGVTAYRALVAMRPPQATATPTTDNITGRDWLEYFLPACLLMLAMQSTLIDSGISISEGMLNFVARLTPLTPKHPTSSPRVPSIEGTMSTIYRVQLQALAYEIGYLIMAMIVVWLVVCLARWWSGRMRQRRTAVA